MSAVKFRGGLPYTEIDVDNGPMYSMTTSTLVGADDIHDAALEKAAKMVLERHRYNGGAVEIVADIRSLKRKRKQEE
jgi:hypothetical protein